MLMDVYSESNYENTDYFYPDETDKDDYRLLEETVNRIEK